MRSVLCLLAFLGASLSAPANDLTKFYRKPKAERAIDTRLQINPKKCQVDRETDHGVCMFNYDCYKQKGTVLGTCLDGFLFGACCRLPSSKDTPSAEVTTQKIRTSAPTSATSTQSTTKPSQTVHNDQSSEANFYNVTFIDNLNVPLPVAQRPSIILGNGSVVSLDKITGSHEDSSKKPSQTTTPNKLFTWFSIDRRNKHHQ